MSADIEGLVESSTNLGVISNNEDKIIFEFATRSSVKSLKEELRLYADYLVKGMETGLFTFVAHPDRR